MRRAALFCVIVAIAIVLFELAPLWARGFGGTVGGGYHGGGGFAGGGFGRVPTPSFAYRAPAYSAPRQTYHSAPIYHPGPSPSFTSRIEPYRSTYAGHSNLPQRRFEGRREGAFVGQARGNVLGGHAVNHVVNNHWDHWHGHDWDGHWHHGHWHGHWDNYWWGGWDGGDWWDNPWNDAAFLGVTGWGLGSVVYNSGYSAYYNPYYTRSYDFGPTVVDYEQPIQVVDYGEQLPDGSNAPPVSSEATTHADAARQAFYDQDDRLALTEIQKAIGEMPGDPAFHELRALILFALHEYRAAAAAIHSLLAVGPGWDWTTMIGLYPSEEVYTRQLRALETFRRDHPNDAAARFLLAYHYMTMGHTQAAANELRVVVQLVPRDRVADQLLKMITTAPEQNSHEDQTRSSTPAGQEEPNATLGASGSTSGPPVDAAALMGSWTAQREDGSTIQLTLTPDSKFIWRFKEGEKTREFAGTATVAKNLLVLQQANGESIVGRVVPIEGGGFRFHLAGAPPDEPELSFNRAS